MKSDFQRILREKMHQQATHESDKQAISSQDSEPLHLAFLLGTLGKTSFATSKNKSYFQAKTYKIVTEKPANAALPEIPTPPAHLSVRQKEGWLWFWKRGAPLSEDFTKVEIQRQFRALARVLHPDQNPHPKAAESFILLREHYEQLLITIE